MIDTEMDQEKEKEEESESECEGVGDVGSKEAISECVSECVSDCISKCLSDCASEGVRDHKQRTAPRYKWTRQLSEAEPSRRVHTFSRPPVLEALQLLPVAARVGAYILQERKKKREPIFDLNVSE
jgi:hypothetical protein